VKLTNKWTNRRSWQDTVLSARFWSKSRFR